MPNSNRPSEKISSHELHNRNCFNYLIRLNIADSVLEQFPNPLKQQLVSLRGESPADYNPKTGYADIYTNFFVFIEDKINELYPPDLPHKNAQERQLAAIKIENFTKNIEQSPEDASLFRSAKDLESTKLQTLYKQQKHIDDWDAFILSIYKNDNSILPATYEIIKKVTATQNPTQKGLEHLISEHVKDSGNSVNIHTQSPAAAGSLQARGKALFSSNFKTQHETSIATIRRYEWNKESAITEQRIGTQGQRHHGLARVSPLYERYLDCEARQSIPDKITNIYFNNLGRDRTSFEGKKEKELTDVLERAEERNPNLAVITLPADKGLMDHHRYLHTDAKHSYQSVKAEFLKIAAQDPSVSRSIRDFYISPKIRERLFINERGSYSVAAEIKKLNTLLDDSFAAMGIGPDAVLSDAQQQAVWFHFIKFTLTDYIINTLNPKNINFSCKDAIDRGGVSSAYYNLQRSFASPNPMSRDEFEQALHAAPTMVKGRGMNFHLNIIWNVVDNYLNANYAMVNDDPQKAWLIEWRDANCPHDRVDDLLKSRLSELANNIVKAQSDISNPLHGNPAYAKGLEQGLKILEAIKIQADIGVSGKRLLLNAAIQTASVAIYPNRTDVQAYNKLADDICVTFPKLKIIGGLMKVLIGIAITVLSLGILKKQGTAIEEHGIATARSGFESISRKTIQVEMKKQLENYKEGWKSMGPTKDNEINQLDSDKTLKR